MMLRLVSNKMHGLACYFHCRRLPAAVWDCQPFCYHSVSISNIYVLWLKPIPLQDLLKNHHWALHVPPRLMSLFFVANKRRQWLVINANHHNSTSFEFALCSAVITYVCILVRFYLVRLASAVNANRASYQPTSTMSLRWGPARYIVDLIFINPHTTQSHLFALFYESYMLIIFVDCMIYHIKVTQWIPK